jgi:hypothetical protein
MDSDMQMSDTMLGNLLLKCPSITACGRQLVTAQAKSNKFDDIANCLIEQLHTVHLRQKEQSDDKAPQGRWRSRRAYTAVLEEDQRTDAARHHATLQEGDDYD